MEPRPQDLRNNEFKLFSLHLIDGRHELETVVKNHATGASINLSGYSRDDLKLPQYLGLPRSSDGVSGVLDFEVKSVKGKQKIAKIFISPEDSAPFTIKDDYGIIVQESGDSVSPLPSTALEDTLFSLFPENVRYKLTVDNAIEVISQLSPQSSTTFEFENDSADFLSKITLSNTETVDDSIFSLELKKTYIHPSGLLVGTRMNLSESIQRQMSGVDVTKNTVAIDINQNSSPFRSLSFEDMFSDNRIVPVAEPTKRHIDDATDVISRLYGSKAK